MGSVSLIARVLRHPFLTGATLIVAAVAGVLSTYTVDWSGPALHGRTSGYGFAQKPLVVDSLQSSVFNRRRDLAAITDRTETLAAILTSERVRDDLAQRLRFAPSRLDLSLYQSSDRVGDNVDALAQLQGVIRRSAEYVVQLDPQRRGPQDNFALPVISVTVRGPTAAGAARVADAMTATAARYIDERNAISGVADTSALKVTGVGRARSATVNSGMGQRKAVLVFLLVAGVGFAVVAALDALLTRDRVRRPEAKPQAIAED